MPVIALPGTLVYTVKQRSESITLLARHFLAQTSYMTVPELEAAIRRANLDKKGNYFKKGDRVLTSGGIYGTIQSVEAEVVYLKIAENVKVKVTRSAITGITTGDAAE